MPISGRHNIAGDTGPCVICGEDLKEYSTRRRPLCWPCEGRYAYDLGSGDTATSSKGN